MNPLMNMDLIQIPRNPGSRDKGRWVEGSRKPPIPFKGNAQPAPGKVQELLPDGKRNRETITVRTPVRMNWSIADPKEERSGDIVVHKGQEYEVQIAKQWDSGMDLPVDHWDVIATKAKEGAT